MVTIKSFELETKRDSLIKISDNVSKVIEDSNIKNGIVVVEADHSTASILMVASYGKEVLEDVVKEMRKIVPARITYLHQDSPENAAGHIKSSLFGTSVSLIVKDGKLLCNGKQDVYFLDYDGPRNRKYSVCVMGE